MKWAIAALLSATIVLGYQQAGHAEQAAAGAPTAPAAPAAKPLSADDIDAAILDRQLVMQQLDKDVEKLGSIFATATPAAQLVPTLQSIAKGAQESQKSFQIKAPGGSTKAEAWTDPKFAVMMDQFATKSAELVKTGQTGSLADVGTASVDALVCKQCHDVYRNEKKK